MAATDCALVSGHSRYIVGVLRDEIRIQIDKCLPHLLRMFLIDAEYNCLWAGRVNHENNKSKAVAFRSYHRNGVAVMPSWKAGLKCSRIVRHALSLRALPR
jgi:hypothetical protein